jgi:hypothetical protein
MAKKKTEIEKLTDALKKVKPKHNRGNPNPIPPPERYWFKPGQCANPSGRPKEQPRDHARQAMNRLAHSSPPKNLCEQIGIEPNCTWIEAIVFSLGKAAASGDVSAAREVLANLGLRGTAANSILAVNVETPESMGLFATFCKHMAGVPEAEYPKIWAFMQTLARPSETDGDCMPPTTQQLLIEGN